MRHTRAVQADHPTHTEPLSVALSLLTLVPGGMGGTETYARELCRGLAAAPGASARTFVSAAARGWTPAIEEVVVESVAGGGRPRDRLRTLTQARLARGTTTLDWADADLVHYPVTVFAPWPRSGPTAPAVVQTLHDVQHLDLPRLFSPVDRLYRRRWYEAAARRADLVLTISEFSRTTIVEHLGIEPEKVRVAHLAVGQDFVPHLGDREPFLLYPARGWAHKNHRRLIEAVALARRTHPDLRLVLTGGALDSIGEVPDWVDRRGLVPRSELIDLYRSASALVFPSLYEGFGLPPLEAMASGCPVVASTNGSLPEICGRAAEYVDALDPESIASGIVAALGRSAELAALGLERAKRFTWEACVAAHLDAYAAVAP